MTFSQIDQEMLNELPLDIKKELINHLSSKEKNKTTTTTTSSSSSSSSSYMKKNTISPPKEYRHPQNDSRNNDIDLYTPPFLPSAKRMKSKEAAPSYSEPNNFVYPNLTQSQIEFLQSIPIEFHKDVLSEITSKDIIDISSTPNHINSSNSAPVHSNLTLTSSDTYNNRTTLSSSNQKAKKNPVSREDAINKISEFLKKLGS